MRKQTDYTLQVNQLLKDEPDMQEDVDAIREGARLFGRLLWIADHASDPVQVDGPAEEFANFLIVFAKGKD